jgi:heptosyltransferase I
MMTSAPTPTAPPRRVLVVRLSAIGDVIMASGLVPVLHGAWPQAQIAWLTQDGNAALLRANPRLAEVIVLPRSRWAKLWAERRYVAVLRELLAFARDLRARRFDLVLDLQGLLKSGVWARLAGAPQRIGLGSREGSARLMTRVVARDVPDDRLGKEYRALAVALGLDAARFAMDIVVPEADAAAAQALLREPGIGPDYVVFAPFTTRPQKHWLDERWPTLAQRVAAERGWRAVLLGGPADRERAEAMAAAAAGTAVALAGRTSLTEAAAVIRGARVLVGVDTGLTHLGVAMATPTLALFGSTCPYLRAPEGRLQVVYLPRPCSPCRRNPTCDGRFDCMREISVDRVVAGVADLLAASQSSALSPEHGREG